MNKPDISFYLYVVFAVVFTLLESLDIRFFIILTGVVLIFLLSEIANDIEKLVSK